MVIYIKDVLLTKIYYSITFHEFHAKVVEAQNNSAAFPTTTIGATCIKNS